mmetsp:Transcript_12078/g.14976  ORF Transcript_12078/g.14976 Transcript_12078/m.14976 type:complete len:242 (+) Transcript_12078:53-778(+)
MRVASTLTIILVSEFISTTCSLQIVNKRKLDIQKSTCTSISKGRVHPFLPYIYHDNGNVRFNHNKQRTTFQNKRTILCRGGDTALAASISNNISPPTSTWIIPALLCALSYALYNISIKKASSSIDHVLGGVLLQIVAATFGAILFSLKVFSIKRGSAILMTKYGIIWSIYAGITVGAAEILSFYVSSKGVQAMQSIPVIVGGSILFGTVLGRLWLKEVISVKGWIGVFLISVGIILSGCS